MTMMGTRGPTAVARFIGGPSPGSGRDTTRLRLGVLGGVLLSLFAPLLARLWYPQVPVAEDVPMPTLVYLREHQAEFPGVDVVQLTRRTYPNADLAAHVLGYVGEINDKELEAHKAQGYRGGDTIGKSGVELAYESELRGTPEVEKLQVDAQGRVLRSLGKQPAVPGHDVKLTIDLDIQRLSE